jgi:hypothetical protein
VQRAQPSLPLYGQRKRVVQLLEVNRLLLLALLLLALLLLGQ